MLKRLLTGIFVVASTVVAWASFNPVPLSTYGAPDDFYYTSVVSLHMKQENDGVVACTGTLIYDLRELKGLNIGYVLTAAHCVKDAKSIEVGFFSDNTGQGDPIVRPGARWKWAESFTGEDMNYFNGERIHDWAVILVKDIPDHVKPMTVGLGWRPDGSETGTDSVFLVARDESDNKRWVSPLYAVPFKDSLPFGDVNTTRMWRSDVVQPLEPNGLRGICMGNSGGPVVKVVQGRPFLVGVVSAEGGTFPVIGQKQTFRCGTDAYWYNATLAIQDLSGAIRQEAIDEGIISDPSN